VLIVPTEPSVVLGILAACAAYTLAATHWRARLGGPALPDRRRAWFFAAAMLVLSVALLSPLDRVADEELFSVHVVQHLLLILAFPPLLLAGLPGWMLRPLLLRSATRRALAWWLTRPLPAYVIFNVGFAVSHVPLVFNLVQAHPTLHALEHLVYIATATLMWWPVLSPLRELPRIPYPAQMLYLFLQTLGGLLVGSIVSLSGQPIYTRYVATAPAWGLTPLQDQQIGGLIMWVGGGLYFLVAIGVVFFVWAADDAAEQRRHLQRLSGGPMSSRAR